VVLARKAMADTTVKAPFSGLVPALQRMCAPNTVGLCGVASLATMQ